MGLSDILLCKTIDHAFFSTLFFFSPRIQVVQYGDRTMLHKATGCPLHLSECVRARGKGTSFQNINNGPQTPALRETWTSWGNTTNIYQLLKEHQRHLYDECMLKWSTDEPTHRSVSWRKKPAEPQECENIRSRRPCEITDVTGHQIPSHTHFNHVNKS